MESSFSKTIEERNDVNGDEVNGKVDLTPSDPTSSTQINADEPPKLSKNQQKKLAKKALM